MPDSSVESLSDSRCAWALSDPEFEVFTASDGEAAIRYTPPSPPSDSVRRAELEARAALEARRPDAWELVRAAHARRKMAERDRASNGK